MDGSFSGDQTAQSCFVVSWMALDGSAFETTESKQDDGYFWVSNQDGSGHPEQCGIFGFYSFFNSLRVQSWNGERWKYFGDFPDDDVLGSDSDSEDEEDAVEEGYSGSDSDSDDADEEDEEEEEMNDEEPEDKEEMEDAEKEEVVEMEEQENNLREFTMSCSSPVLHKGLWYFLGEEGSLGVYDPKKNDYSVLHKPTSFDPEFPHKNCYLVESNQELLAVLTGRNGTPIHVLTLKEKEMTWERMDSLGSRAIFTGTVASISMDRPPKAMENKVYLPKFYGRPQIIPAKLTTCGGRLFFVPERKEMQGPSSNKSVYVFMGEHGTCGDKNGAWCYDLGLDSRVDKEITGCKSMLQYIWVHLGCAST